MSSRRRPYLNLKQSITELFKTPAHWLKEMTGKWSIFDKPYLDQDYRAMHLNWSAPTWKGSGGAVPPHAWPKVPGKHTFIFSEGTCTISTFGEACGEVIVISGWIWEPYFTTLGQTWAWSAVSSNPGLAGIVGMDVSGDGISARIKIQLSDTESGTATICVKATMIGGTMLKEIAYQIIDMPKGWIPNILYAFANLLPLYEKRKTISHDCGCVDIAVTCECENAVWDTAASAETVAASSSCSVAIKDGTGGDRTWEVSGTGAWLDAGFTITSLTNQANSVTIYTDASACGSITVSACGVTGYVRCTTGQWVLTSTPCDYNPGGGGYGCEAIVDNLKHVYALRSYDCFHVGYCTPDGAYFSEADWYGQTCDADNSGLSDCTYSGSSPPGCDFRDCWALQRIQIYTWMC